MGNIYYEVSEEEVFTKVKTKAIEIWKTYDNTYGYVTEKVDRIKDLQNIRDNFMFMVAMFDIENQTRLANLLSEEARQAISDRMVALVDNPPSTTPLWSLFSVLLKQLKRRKEVKI